MKTKEKTKETLRKVNISCQIVVFLTIPSFISYMFHYPEFNKEGVTLISLILLTLLVYVTPLRIKRFKPNINLLITYLATIIVLGVLLIVNMTSPAIVYTVGMIPFAIAAIVTFTISFWDLVTDDINIS